MGPTKGHILGLVHMGDLNVNTSLDKAAVLTIPETLVSYSSPKYSM
jgi:hypothetical protein